MRIPSEEQKGHKVKKMKHPQRDQEEGLALCSFDSKLQPKLINVAQQFSLQFSSVQSLSHVGLFATP